MFSSPFLLCFRREIFVGWESEKSSRDKMMSDEFSSQLCFFYDIHDLVNNFVSHSYRVTYFYFISRDTKEGRKTHREPWLGAEKLASARVNRNFLNPFVVCREKTFLFLFLMSFFGSQNKNSRALEEFIRPPLDWWWENNSTRETWWRRLKTFVRDVEHVDVDTEPTACGRDFISQWRATNV